MLAKKPGKYAHLNAECNMRELSPNDILIIAEMSKRGALIKEIAAALKCSGSAVTNARRKHGIKKAQRPKPEQPKPEWNARERMLFLLERRKKRMEKKNV